MFNYHTLSRDTFENEWRSHFEAQFRQQEDGLGARWLPDQVFAHKGTLLFSHPEPYYLRRCYHGLEQALHTLGEKAFAVVDREAIAEGKRQVGLLFRLSTSACQPEDEGQYIIERQPLEFYAFGRSEDWSLVSSEPFNIGILNAQGSALEAVRGAWQHTDEAAIAAYLEHTPAHYRRQFEQHYVHA